MSYLPHSTPKGPDQKPRSNDARSGGLGPPWLELVRNETSGRGNDGMAGSRAAAAAADRGKGAEANSG